MPDIPFDPEEKADRFKPMNKRYEIVITGGPCAGKSAALLQIETAFREQGYAVLTVPETATELINGGVTVASCGSAAEFQRRLLIRQLEKEARARQTADALSADRILIVYDRGAPDGSIYITPEEFGAAAAELGTDLPALRTRYNAVFHLLSTATDAPSFYTTQNNAARTETAEQAAALDEKLLTAWEGHPHRFIIPSEARFSEKCRHLLSELAAFLEESPFPS